MLAQCIAPDKDAEAGEMHLSFRQINHLTGGLRLARTCEGATAMHERQGVLVRGFVVIGKRAM